MNIQEAIKLLKQGTPVYRVSKEAKYYYFRVRNEELDLNLYGSRSAADKEDWYGSCRETESFDIEEIEATDWEIYRPTT